jgi:hypothetical protein
MTTSQRRLEPATLARQIRHEFTEWPGLRLTLPQARRLWGVDSVTCERALDTLLDAAFLRQLWDRTYVRADWPGDRSPAARCGLPAHRPNETGGIP